MCKQCGLFKPFEAFGWKLRGKRLAARCAPCRSANYHENPQRCRERARVYYHSHKEHYKAQGRQRREGNIAKHLVQAAKRRARKRGIECTLRESDVVVPSHCPVLGMPLVMNTGKCGPDSPTLDRIDATVGYVAGNIIVVSFRANTLKSDSTPAELLRVAAFYAPLYGIKSADWAGLTVNAVDCEREGSH